MTLLITSIAPDSIVMMADSAATTRLGHQAQQYYRGIAKVFYLRAHNVAVGSWGVARLREAGTEITTDAWLAAFARELEGLPPLSLRQVAGRISERLAVALAEKRQADGLTGHELPWQYLRMGLHVAGYEAGEARLLHVLTGRSRQEAAEPRVVLEHPADHAEGSVHGPLGDCQHWDGDTSTLEVGIAAMNAGHSQDRVSYCASVISHVARSLADGDRGINDEVSFVEFDPHGPRSISLIAQADWQPI